MKRLITLLAVVGCSLSSFAQFNYQAVIRDSQGDIVPEQDVSVLLSIWDSSSTSKYYTESHDVTTSAHGVINLIVGEGDQVSGLYKNIDWSQQGHLLEVSVDLTGGTFWVELGKSRIVSVPQSQFAMEAKQANHADSAGVAEVALLAESANMADHAQASDYADSSGHATTAETAFRMPLVTTAERDILSVEVGRVVYNTDLNKFQGVADVTGSAILDQDALGASNSGNSVRDAFPRTGQQFTNGVDGSLDKVEFEVSSVATQGTFNLVIYDGNSYAGAVLSTTPFLVDHVGIYEVELSTKPILLAGQMYVWAVEYISSGSIGIGVETNNQYAGGSYCSSSTCGGGCCDLPFKTYVAPSGPAWVDLH